MMPETALSHMFGIANTALLALNKLREEAYQNNVGEQYSKVIRELAIFLIDIHEAEGEDYGASRDQDFLFGQSC